MKYLESLESQISSKLSLSRVKHSFKYVEFDAARLAAPSPLPGPRCHPLL